MSRSHSIKVSRSHSVAVSQCHSVMESQSHSLTVSAAAGNAEILHGNFFMQMTRKNIKEDYFEENTGIKTVVNNIRVQQIFRGEFQDRKKNGNLKSHIQSVHEKVKYYCNLCEFKATQRGNLKTHIVFLSIKSNAENKITSFQSFS